MRPTVVKTTLISMLAAAALLGASCSSDSSDAASDSNGTSDSSSIAEAKSAVEELIKRPTQIQVTTPLEGDVPTGKTAAWLECSIPDCQILGPPLAEALNEFGWKMNTIDAGLTPEKVKDAWGLAVRGKPGAVFATGFGQSIFSEELGQLTSAGIPVINGFVADKSGKGGVSAVIGGSETSRAIGDAFANWVLAEKGKDAKVLLVHSSTFPTLLDVREGFETRYKELCSTCKLEVLDVPAEKFGAGLPAEVVAKLQSNRDINYVVADEGSMLLGLPQAMETANLNDIGVIGQYPSETSVEYLSSGKIVKAIVMPSMTDAMWNMADAMARLESGQSIAENEAAGPIWIVTPKTASQLKTPYHLIEGYQDEYRKLWSGVTGG
ncbi:MAG TPA: substrate-binding domain-containing protein [Microthrixaceae bacterium]|nr:substrate-binding domain-containing protein [Microthrixaceae bacterium]